MLTNDRVAHRDPSSLWIRTRQQWPLMVACIFFAVAWILVVLFDAMGLGAPLGVTREAMTWLVLFGANGPVEWVQWTYLIIFVTVAGYRVGRLSSSESEGLDDGIRRFCLVMAVGVGFMLLEDAGDIRHTINLLVARFRAGDIGDPEPIFGVPQAFLIDAPYLTLISVVPLYALLRYGRSIWALRPTRPYLVLGFGVYGLVGAAHVVGRFGDEGAEFGGVYPYLGELLHRFVFAGSLERSADYPPDMFFYDLIDGVVEETPELVAVPRW